ncbi:MAG: aryl-sulfate sulfotransferase [Pseudomonadota bacterium]
MTNLKKLFTAVLIAASAVALIPNALAQSVHPKGVTILDPAQVDWGLVFFTPPDGIPKLIGLDGTLVREWGQPSDQIQWARPNFDLSGDILALTGAVPVLDYPFPLPDKMAQFDADGNLFFEWNDFPLSKGTFAAVHHDMIRLPNGNTMVLCATVITVPTISPNPLLDECILEMDWNGDIVWEWYAHEHFDQFGFTDEAKQLISDAAGDWAHSNSLSIIPDNNHTDPAFTPGNVMVSFRELNTIVIIDRASEDIVWKVGPHADRLTIGQHDAQMIPLGRPGAGNIIAFDNGLRAGYPPISRPFSQVIEIDPTTKQVVWRYNATFSGFPQWDFFSAIISGATRLENGNTMITEGTKGRLIQVTQTGEIVWEFMSPYFEANPGPGGVDVKNYAIFRGFPTPLWWGLPLDP